MTSELNLYDFTVFNQLFNRKQFTGRFNDSD